MTAGLGNSRPLVSARSGIISVRCPGHMLAVPDTLFCSAPALGQSDAKNASAQAQQEPLGRGDPVQSRYALGDWGSLRVRYPDCGINFAPGYLAKIADVASGRQRHRLDCAHQIKLQAGLDGGKLMDWQREVLSVAFPRCAVDTGAWNAGSG